MQDDKHILFVTKGELYKLQMMQIDGKDFHTLYCASGKIENISWSHDQNFILFDVMQMPYDSNMTMYLLNLISGIVQPELVYPSQESYIPFDWYDNNRVYVIHRSSARSNPVLGLFMLDLRNQDQRLWIATEYATKGESEKGFSSLLLVKGAHR